MEWPPRNVQPRSQRPDGRRAIQWKIQLPATVIREPAGLHLLTQAKAKRKNASILSVSVHIEGEGFRCTRVYKSLQLNTWALPVLPLPKSRIPLKVYLHVTAESPEAIRQILCCFTEPRGRKYLPIAIHQCFTPEGLSWLQSQVINKELTAWEKTMLWQINAEDGYISYTMCQKHRLAGAICVKAFFTKLGCKSEFLMRNSFSYLGLGLADLVEEMSTLFTTALKPVQRVLKFFHNRSENDPDLNRSEFLMTALAPLLDIVESKFNVVLYPDKDWGFVAIMGAGDACCAVHTYLIYALSAVEGDTAISIHTLTESQNLLSIHKAVMDMALNKFQPPRTLKPARDMTFTIHVDDIRFTQGRVYDTFSNGTSVMDLVTQILSQKQHHLHVPLIRVVKHAEVYWSLDNRRLLVYKLCCLGNISVELRAPDLEFVGKLQNGQRFHDITNHGQRVGIYQRRDSVALPRSHVICLSLSRVSNLMSTEAQANHEAAVVHLSTAKLNEDADCSRTSLHLLQATRLVPCCSNTHGSSSEFSATASSSSLWTPQPLQTGALDSAEQPALIAPQEASQIVAIQEADFIQRLLDVQGMHGHVALSEPEASDDKLVLLKFNRHPREFYSALSAGMSLQKCRTDLEAEGYDWKLPSGGMLFVHPSQFHLARQAICNMEITMGHVVVSESLEYLIEESLASFRKGVWAKSRHQLDFEGNESVVATVGSDSETEEDTWLDYNLDVERTFLQYVPKLLDAASVVQSTTEANTHGLNPRRINADLLL